MCNFEQKLVLRKPRFLFRYKCDGCRTIIREPDPLFDVGEYFAGVIARRKYGHRAVFRILRKDYNKDSSFCMYHVFIGRRNIYGEFIGHNIHFVVVTEVL